MSEKEKNAGFSMTPQQYRTIYGSSKFSFFFRKYLFEFKLSLPQMQALKASGMFSHYSFQILKTIEKRKKIKKLVFIYTNSELMDDIDSTDYSYSIDLK